MGYSAGDLQVGFGVESTWNTGVAPTRYVEVISESLKADRDRMDSKGLRSGRTLEGKDKFVAGKVDVGGDIELELQTKGIGFLFGHMLGATVSTTTASGGTSAKTHTYSMKATETTDGKGLTAHVVRTDVAGARQRFGYSGVKVQSWELSSQAGEICTMKLTLDGANETVNGSSAYAATTPSYSSSSIPLVFTGAAISVDGSSFEVKNCSIKGDNSIKTDRFVLGSNIKREQVQAGLRTVTGQLGVEFAGTTAYNYVVNANAVAFQAKFESVAEIEVGVKASVVVNLPDIRFDGETPNGGGQIIEHNLSFVALDNESNDDSPCTIAYTTLDTTP